PKSPTATPEPPAAAPAAPTAITETQAQPNAQPQPIAQPVQPVPAASGSSTPPSTYDALVARYGKEKVVRVVVTNPSDIVAQINEASTAISKAAPEMLVCEMT